MSITALIDALRAGNELRNAEAWKHRATATNAIAAVLVAALWLAQKAGLRIDADPELVNAVAAGAAGLVCMFNAYLFPATSARVGVLPERPADPGPGDGFGPTPGVNSINAGTGTDGA